MTQVADKTVEDGEVSALRCLSFYEVTPPDILRRIKLRGSGTESHIYQLKQNRKRKARKSQRMGSKKTKQQKKRAGLQQTKHVIAKECSPKKNA